MHPRKILQVCVLFEYYIVGVTNVDENRNKTMNSTV